MTINIALRLLGSLALLIFGMKMMSEALQKMAGAGLRHVLARMTANRLSGMMTGTFVTCAVQSSSATTVMTVSFVSAGLLTLTQAISIIMGANIGTTLTAWIMSLGYNVDLTNYDPSMAGQADRLPVVLALFHTCFNVLNTAILLPFVPQMERVVCRFYVKAVKTSPLSNTHVCRTCSGW